MLPCECCLGHIGASGSIGVWGIVIIVWLGGVLLTLVALVLILAAVSCGTARWRLVRAMDFRAQRDRRIASARNDFGENIV